LKYPNESKFEGDFEEDKKRGKGTLYYANGDKYTGELKDDKRDGKGNFH